LPRFDPLPPYFILSHNFITLALDLRSLQHEFHEGLIKISSEEFSDAFGSMLSENDAIFIKAKVASVLIDAFDATSTMDAEERMQKVAASSTTPLLDFFTGPSFSDPSVVGHALTCIPTFRTRVASRAYSLLDDLRRDYLSGARGPAPASRYLNRTRPVYEFVRLTLGIRMHGSENYHRFVNGLGVDDVTVGQNVSLIHEVRFVLLSSFLDLQFFFVNTVLFCQAIRDGKLQPVIVELFSSMHSQ
jgi:phenylalanine ammonia-lyase